MQLVRHLVTTVMTRKELALMPECMDPTNLNTGAIALEDVISDNEVINDIKQFLFR